MRAIPATPGVRALAMLAMLGALGVSGAACGPGLVAGDSADWPLLSIPTRLEAPADALATADPPLHHPIVGLLWTDPLQRQPDVTAPARWLSSSTPTADQKITAGVFLPPPAEALVDITMDGETSRLAIAEIVLIDDGDDDSGADGTFHVSGDHAEIAPPDTYLAGTDVVLVYVARRASWQSSFPLAPVPGTGYYLVAYHCNGPVPLEPIPPLWNDVVWTFQRSRFLPEVRTCRLTHST